MNMRRTVPFTLSYKVILFCIALSTIACWPSGVSPTAENHAEDGKDIVAIVHGFGRSKYAMWLLASRIKDAGFLVELIGYRSIRDTPQQILADIGRQLDTCCIGKSNRLHFVGYSLGGLLIRAYLADQKPVNLGRVVVVGTPNNGVKIVDDFNDSWWFKLLGPTAQQLGTDPDGFPQSVAPPEYPLGVIAGEIETSSDERILLRESDGLVAIESTKIPGMTDFAIVRDNHWAMRYSNEVAHLVLNFLRTGRFERE